MIQLRRPSPERLRAVIAAEHDAPFTYEPVGATAADALPPGFDPLRMERGVGTGDEVWARAVAGLRSWSVHRGAGLEVATDGPVEPGTTSAMAASLPVGFAIVACRVVYVEETPDLFAFAYGTLPTHPESGEERFEVVKRGDQVVFVVSAFSRPRHPLARLGRPVARAMQRRATVQYLDSMTKLASAERS
jgi:uncharacterized protein (UPF0548 family)